MSTLSKILGWIIVALMLAVNCCLAQPAPEYRINTPAQKYLALPHGYQAYFCRQRRTIVTNQATIYTCPTGSVILDFAVYQHQHTRWLGVLFTNQARVYLEIYHLDRSESQLVKNMTLYQPWKIQFADVDRDAIPEVCLGVYKTSPLHAIETKRLFIYNFQAGLQPKWRGSRLARPFVDFVFVEDGRQTLLVALEVTQTGGFCLNSYHWDSFGFTRTDTPINGAAAQATSLSLGYRLQTVQPQPLLIMLNQTTIIQTFNLGGSL